MSLSDIIFILVIIYIISYNFYVHYKFRKFIYNTLALTWIIYCVLITSYNSYKNILNYFKSKINKLYNFVRYKEEAKM